MKAKFVIIVLSIYISLLFQICCSPVNKYRHKEDFSIWENDIKKFEFLDSTEEYPEKSILFAGSSSIRLWLTIKEDMAPYPVIQRGYGGAKLSDFAYYAERIIYPHQFKAIVLFIANDISGSEYDKTPEEVAELFKYILKVIRKKYPEIPVFWIQITPTWSRWEVWEEINQANELIKNICEKSPNTCYIKTSHYFLNEKGIPKKELFIEDNLHLNREGYKIWTDIIKNELDKYLNKDFYKG